MEADRFLEASRFFPEERFGEREASEPDLDSLLDDRLFALFFLSASFFAASFAAASFATASFAAAAFAAFFFAASLAFLTALSSVFFACSTTSSAPLICF